MIDGEPLGEGLWALIFTSFCYLAFALSIPVDSGDKFRSWFLAN